MTTLAAGYPARKARVPAGGGLPADVTVPPVARGVIVFAHASGSSRLSPRNQRVAAGFQADGFATVLFDLLTWDEDSYDHLGGRIRFDVEMLAGRLAAATDWLGTQADLADLPVGYFGAGNGAAAALAVAAAKPEPVKAVVCRGGRPDLARTHLPDVVVPTLLIVGSLDAVVIRFNRDALDQLATPVKQLTIVPGASHLFEEAGTLEQAAAHALDWFSSYASVDAATGECWEIC
jgi:putative phosphoribosyl transferase